MNSANMNHFLKFIQKFFGSSAKTLYHYTTMEALVNGIIVANPKEGKEICMRATHSDYMNDTSEVLIGVRFLAEYYFKQQTDPVGKDKYINAFMRGLSPQWRRYIISFSTKDDSLPMWNTYSDRGKGIVIGFEDMDSLNYKDLLLRCIYDAKELENILNETPQNDNDSSYQTLLKVYLPLILKDAAYSYEDEVRLIGVFEKSPQLFKYKKNLPVPYKEIFFKKEKMTSITIGPAADKEKVKKSLQRFLDNREFEHVKVKYSNIPYRDF